MTTQTTLYHRLAQLAALTPDKPALRFESDVLTYRELEDRASRLAHGLAGLGVQPRDPVCVLFETSCDYVASWMALSRLGAVEAPINTGFRGPALAHALRLTNASVLLVDAQHVASLAQVLEDVPNLSHVVLRGEAHNLPTLRGVSVTAFRDLELSPHAVPPAASRPDETAMLLFTSGTTGPSKACAIPHRYTVRQGEIFCKALGVGADDVLYAPFPLFHADGAIFTVAAALACGGGAALAPRFSVSNFWSDCRRHGATLFDYMGATLALLHKQPPSPADRDHQLRLGWGVPAPPFAEAFEARFGVELVEVYGLTDVGIVLYNRPGEPRRAGSCGRVVAPFELQIQDADGQALGVRQTGELVVRAHEPDVILSGYYDDPTATQAAFRNGWFRTGDLVQRDEDGFYYFVGRLKDIIRRRGENISAFDLEQALLVHPDILEAAAYGVPSELTEEDIMVTIVPRPGTRICAQDVFDWLAARLAPHMAPRYVRLATSIPRTETEKAAKYKLKELGVTADTVEFDVRTRTPLPREAS